MTRHKKGPVNTPAALVNRTIKDSHGRVYTYDKFFRVGGAPAKRDVQLRGKRLKANGEIQNFRVKKYRNVKIWNPWNERYERRTIYALYVR